VVHWGGTRYYVGEEAYVRKKIGSAAAVALGVSGLILALPGSAGAAGSTSPPAGAVPTSCSVSTTIDVNAASTTSAPATTSLTSTCSYTPGSTVSLSFLGTTQTATADATTGLLTLKLSATDPSLSVNGGAFQAAVYGVNTITATGNNASGGANSATFLIDIENPTATASGSGGGLAFTGADLAALVAAALALIVMGSGVVIYTRRRAGASRKV
jgi:hypothetical protein